MRKYNSISTGQKYGRLTIIKPLGKVKSTSKWECLCDCGNKAVAITHHLYTGLRKSCGCTRVRRNPQLTLVKNMYSDYKYNAKRRQLVFDLSFEDFQKTVLQKCIYCDSAPEIRRITMNKKVYEGRANGVDRIDSDIGYTFDNTMPCCSTCNFMKSNLTFRAFKEHILKIYQHFNNWEILPGIDVEVTDDKEN